MRIISGKYKGTKLLSPHGEVRPTTDLVKGSLFSVLAAKGLIDGAKCLDLFCGSGSLGIEALSRGADSCVFVDADTTNVAGNLAKLKLRERTVRGDFRKALRSLREQRFDLVFCDPPYKTDFAEASYKLLCKYGMLGDTGLAVLEHAGGTELRGIPAECVLDSRTFGATTFTIVRGGYEGDIRGDV